MMKVAAGCFVPAKDVQSILDYKLERVKDYVEQQKTMGKVFLCCDVAMIKSVVVLKDGTVYLVNTASGTLQGRWHENA